MRIFKKTNTLEKQLAVLLPSADQACLAFARAMTQGHDATEKTEQFEAARIAAKYGEDSQRAKEARLLADRHAAEALHWALEQARASRDIPKPEPDHWIVFGMVLDAEGQRVGGARVTAVAEKRGETAHTSTNKDGEYELRISAEGRVRIQVSRRDGKAETLSKEIFQGEGGKLAYRDYVLPASTSYTRTGRKRR